MTKILTIGPSFEFIYCKCGCGNTRSKYQIREYGGEFGTERKDKPKLFINGHNRVSKEILSKAQLGRKHSEETKKKMSISAGFAEKHHNWKGEQVGNSGLHAFIKRHLPKPELCELCGVNKPRELANITGIYAREFNNWGYFCAKCHRKYDNVQYRMWAIRKLRYGKSGKKNGVDLCPLSGHVRT